MERKEKTQLCWHFSLHFSQLLINSVGSRKLLKFNFRFFTLFFIYISFPDVPSTPGRPLIMAFSSRTVNLSWAPPLDSHNSPVLGYLIKQRMGEDSSWEYSKEIRTGSNSTEFSVRGLQPFTVYSFKVN